MYHGDIAPSAILDIKFTSRSSSTGVPTVLSGTPAVSVYKDNSTTQSTTGVTLTVDFDSVVGLNNVRIDTSADGTFYAAGSNFQVVITTGTVGGNSVVGYVIGSFSISNRVVNGLANNVITAASIAASALNGKGDWNIGKTGYALSSAGVQAIWDALTSALTTVGSIGKYIVDNLAYIGSNVSTMVTGVSTINGTTVAIKAKTDLLPSSPSAMTVKKNTAFGPVVFVMRDASGAALTGLSPTAQRSIDGNTYASCTNSVVELSNGTYKHTWSAADLNGTTITFRYSNAGAKDTFITVFPEV